MPARSSWDRAQLFRERVCKAPPAFDSLAEIEPAPPVVRFVMLFLDLRGVAPVRERDGKELPREWATERRVDLRDVYGSPFWAPWRRPGEPVNPFKARTAQVHNEPRWVSELEALKALLAREEPGSERYETLIRQITRLKNKGF